MILGDLGADIVKVEQPRSGDETRQWGPLYHGDQSSTFLAVNRNRRSLTLDLKAPDGKEILASLIRWADVLVENFRPGTMKRLGFSYEESRVINPALIYCSISAFGQSGPYSEQGGYDTIAQAAGGLMSLTGYPDMPPVKVGVPVADISSAAYAAFGILAALHSRETTGKGQAVDIGLMDSAIALAFTKASEFLKTNEVPTPTATEDRNRVPHGAFKAKDKYIVLSIGPDSEWRSICAVEGFGFLRDDTRFKSAEDRRQNKESLVKLLSEAISLEKACVWAERFSGVNLPFSIVMDYSDVAVDLQLEARDMLLSFDHPQSGCVKTVGSPIKLSDTPVNVQRKPPGLGQHSEEILNEIGMSPEQIYELQRHRIT